MKQTLKFEVELDEDNIYPIRLTIDRSNPKHIVSKTYYNEQLTTIELYEYDAKLNLIEAKQFAINENGTKELIEHMTRNITYKE